jgi:RNA polymerase sigma factor (sigma-70 family)
MQDKVLIDKYKSLIQRLAYEISPDYAEDLISVGLNTLLKVSKKFDPTKNVKFTTYARKEIKYDMKDELRKMSWFSKNPKNYQMIKFSDCFNYESELNIEESLIENEGDLLIEGCLDVLSPREREVVTLYYWNSMKIPEIASHLQISEGTVSSTKNNALNKLHRKLSKKGYGKQNTSDTK